MRNRIKAILSVALSLCLLMQSSLPLSIVVDMRAKADATISVSQAWASAPGSSDSARIAGIVWEDEDGDGTMDSDERVLSGIKLVLYQRSEDAPADEPNADPSPETTPEPVYVPEPDTIVAVDVIIPLADGYVEVMSTTSGSNGWYRFEGMGGGEYIVGVKLSGHQSLTQRREDASAFDPSTRRTQKITLKKSSPHADNKHVGVIVLKPTEAGGGDSGEQTEVGDQQTGVGIQPIPAPVPMINPEPPSAPETPVTPTNAPIDPETPVDPDPTPAPIPTDEPTPALDPDMPLDPDPTDDPTPTLDPDMLPDPDPSDDPTPTLDPEAPLDPDPTDEPSPEIDPEATVEPESTLQPEPTIVPDPTVEPDPTVAPDTTPAPEETPDPDSLVEPLDFMMMSASDAPFNLAVGAYFTEDQINDLDANAPNTAAYLKSTFKKELYDITTTEVQKCATLDLSTTSQADDILNATDTSWLNGFTGVKTLNLSGRDLSGALNPTQFPALTSLAITGATGSLTIPAGVWSGMKTLTLDGTDLASVTIESEALPAVTTLTANGASIENMSIAGLSTITSNFKLISANIGTLRFLSGSVAKMTKPDFGSSTITELVFEDGSAPSMNALAFSGASIGSMTIGSGVPGMATFNLTALPVNTLTIKDGALSAATTLNLTNSTLKTLNIESGACPALTTLTMTNLTLTDMSIGEGALGKLATLNLTGSTITDLVIPAGIYPALEILNLTSTIIQSLKLADGACPALKTITLTSSTLESLEIGSGAAPNLATITANTTAATAKLNTLKVGSGVGSALTTLNLTNNPITTLDIANSAFPNMTTLTLTNTGFAEMSIQAGAYPALTTLTLTNCAKLSTLNFGNGALASLTSLNLSGCKNLATLSIPDNTMPKAVMTFNADTGLTDLTIGDNCLVAAATFALAGSNIQNLTIGANSLLNSTTFTVNLNTIQSISIGSGTLPKVTGLSLTNTKNFNALHIGEGALESLTSLNLKNCTGLTDLSIPDNTMPKAVISFDANTGLTDLTIGDNCLVEAATFALAGSRIKHLTIGEGSLLNSTTFTVNVSTIQSIAVGSGSLPKVAGLSLASATSFDTLQIADSALAGLTSLNLTGTKITALSIHEGAYPALATLTLTNSDIATLSIAPAACPALATLTLTNTKITSLDIPANACPALVTLTLTDTNVTSLVIGNGAALTGKTLTLTNVTTLEALHFGEGSFGALTALDMTNYPSIDLFVGEGALAGLTTLNLTGSKKTELDIPAGAFPSLTTLTLTNSDIAELDIAPSACPKLATLTLTGTKITELDIPENACPDLSKITLTNMPAFTSLMIGDGAGLNVSAINFAGTSLETLHIGAGERPNWTSQAISSMSTFKHLTLSPNAVFPKMTKLTISGCAGFTQFPRVSAGQFPALTELSLTNNGLTSFQADHGAVISADHFPALTKYYFYKNPITGHVDATNLPSGLIHLYMNETSISTIDFSGSPMKSMITLLMNNCPNLTSVWIHTDKGSFSSGVLDIFRFSYCSNLSVLDLDTATAQNILQGAGGANMTDIDLFNTKLEYQYILPLVRSESGGSSVQLNLPDGLAEQFVAGDNSTLPGIDKGDAHVAILVSENTYANGHTSNGTNMTLSSGALTDNLLPAYRVQPEVYFRPGDTFDNNTSGNPQSGVINDAYGPKNNMYGPFSASAAAGGLETLFAELPPEVAQGLRVLMANGYPNTGSVEGLSENDYACATSEAIAAFINENLPLDQRVPSFFNYPGDARPLSGDGVFYAQRPGDDKPGGQVLYDSVMALLNAAREAAANTVVSEGNLLKPVLNGNVGNVEDVGENDAYISMNVQMENINTKYRFGAKSDNVLGVEKYNGSGWEALEYGTYRGSNGDQLRIKFNNEDPKASVWIKLLAENVTATGDFYQVNGGSTEEDPNGQDRRYKSDYVTVSGKRSIEHDATVDLRLQAPTYSVRVNHKWGQSDVLASSVALSALHDGDKVVIGSAGVSAASFAGYVYANRFDVVGASASGGSFTIGGSDVVVTFYYQKPVTFTAKSLLNQPYKGSEYVLDGFDSSIQIPGLSGLSATIKGTNANTYINKIAGKPSISGHAFDDLYSAQYIEGKLEIVKIKANVSPESKMLDYNGAEQSVGYTVSGFVAGQTVTVTLKDEKRKNVGDNDVTVAAVSVTANGVDVSANYDITKNTGRITIAPMPLTIKAKSGEFEFDGTEKLVEGYDIASGALAPGDSIASVELTNTRRTEPGQQAVELASVQFSGGAAMAANYAVTKVNGTLLITGSAGEAIVQAEDRAVEYNGQVQSGRTAVAKNLKPGDSLKEYKLTGESANVGEHRITPSGAVIVTGKGDPSKAYSKVNYVDGTLSIRQRNVTITIGKATVDYDGQPHSVDYVASGLIDGHQATIRLSGSPQTEPGTYTVTYVKDSAQITANGQDVTRNYNIKVVAGELTIKPKANRLKITARSVKATYDGEAKSEGGFDAEGLASGDRLSGVAVSGSAINAGVYKDLLVPSGAKITNAAGKDVTATYAIEYVPGTLTIAKRQVQAQAESRAFPFNSQPQKVGYQVQGDFARGDAASGVILSGNVRTIVGKNDVIVGKVSIENAGRDVSMNYEIVKQNGVIEITQPNDLTYLIEYHYGGVLDPSATERRDGQSLGAIIRSYPDKARPGFALSRAQFGPDFAATALTLSLIEGDNVIRIYYEPTGGLQYTVEYHYQNARGTDYELGAADAIGGAALGDMIQEIDQRVQTMRLSGYSHVRTDGLPLTIAADESQNVIKVYYDRDRTLSYRVEYYYDGEMNEAETEVHTGAAYGQLIRKYTDKCRPGQFLKEVENLPMTVQLDSKWNVIRVFYESIGGGEIPETIIEASIPLGAGTGSLNVGECME